jgi:hypothetical protein
MFVVWFEKADIERRLLGQMLAGDGRAHAHAVFGTPAGVGP